MPRLLVAACLLASAALAGGGPETTLVVVNADSQVSRRIANEYVALRDIPPGHAVFVEGIPHLGVIPLDLFKEKIWKPIETFLKEQRLEGQIDLIAYSADFPYGVDIKSRNAGNRQVGNVASLTGLTYLIHGVLAEEDFFHPARNRYYRLDLGAGSRLPRPANAEERALSVSAHEAMGQKRWSRAARDFEALLKTYSGAPRPWYNYACTLAHLRRLDDALGALEKAIETGFRNAGHAASDPDLAPLRGNARFQRLLQRMQQGSLRVLPAHGFRSSYAWDRKTDPVEEGGERYFLSVQLGYTGPWGNSVPEILAYLRAAAQADGTNPDGTVYLCRNDNIRSKTREPFFGALVARMQALGRKVAILEKGKNGQTGVLPVGKDDVFGAVMGIASFSWEKSKSRILPGAICEHLTSLGAHFGTPGQTKISEFFRHGAAGSSGAVAEPYALHFKFPNPLIHAWYAEGCSLAEAFYQSVWSPYQLMVAGDGLARPFARFKKPKVNLPSGSWTGTIEIAPEAADAAFELWVDGRRVASGATLRFDTTTVEDGFHEVRVVAVARDAVETRSYVKFEALVANRPSRTKVNVQMAEPVRLGDEVGFVAVGAADMQVLSGSRVVARGVECSVDTALLGPGPVTLVPRLVLKDGSAVRHSPVEVRIELPRPVAPKLPDHPRKPGLRGTADERDVVVLHLGGRRTGQRLRERTDLADAKLLKLHGEFEVAADGFYQFLVQGGGAVTIEVDGKKLEGGIHRPVALAKGWHPIRIELTPKGPPHLELHLGGDQVLAPPKLRHWSHPAIKQEPKVEINDDGVEISWKRSQSNVAAVTLYPGKEALPAEWVVEYTSGHGKSKAVKDLQRVVAPRPEKPFAFIELSFKPVRAKKLRVRPKEGGKAAVARVEVLGKKKT